MANHKKALAGLAGMMLDGIMCSVRYLPLAYAINVIRLHQNTGYDRYLETMVGSEVLSREADNVRELATWGGDLQAWTNARLSYWSDILAFSLSPSGLTNVVLLAIAFGVVSAFLGMLSGDLHRAAVNNADAQPVVRGSSLHERPTL